MAGPVKYEIPATALRQLPDTSAYADLLARGQTCRRRRPSGIEDFIDAYLGDMSLSEFLVLRAEDVDQLERERPQYSPALWRRVTEELRAELDGIYYCSRLADRTAIRELWERAKDMAKWHLRPIWGSPDADALRSLEIAHRAYFGDYAPFVMLDEWNRRVRRAAKPAILKESNYACVRCGSMTRLSVDHIVPIMRGGLNYALNFQTLCMPCNVWKSARVWWPGAPDGISELFPRCADHIFIFTREERRDD